MVPSSDIPPPAHLTVSDEGVHVSDALSPRAPDAVGRSDVSVEMKPGESLQIGEAR